MIHEIKIIPAINETDFSEILKKIKIIKPISNWAHLDVADGSFTENSLWHEAADLEKLNSEISIEAHFMMKNLENKISEWLEYPIIKRVIFNLEASENPDFIMQICHKKGIQAGVSICPVSSLDLFLPYLEKADLFQILSVIPGKSGQKFTEDSLEKIKKLRKICPECVIESDGGINPDTAKKAAYAGADILVSSSYIFSGNISEIKNRMDGLKKCNYEIGCRTSD